MHICVNLGLSFSCTVVGERFRQSFVQSKLECRNSQLLLVNFSLIKFADQSVPKKCSMSFKCRSTDSSVCLYVVTA